MRYTFGTSETAAARLETIAAFFNPLAAKFIRQHVSKPVQTSVDLGCGPGFTTRMLSEASGAFRTFGLDRSDQFLKMAETRFPGCAFIQHDVTKIPFPVTADVMYARFLLSHLPDAVSMVNLWAGELNTDGFLLIDELEDIRTGVDIFQRYLEIAEGLVASQNALLYAGSVLAGGTYSEKVLANECAVLPVTNARAAEWFYPNTVSIWEEESFVLDNTTAKERKDISSALRHMRDTNDRNQEISWIMRRVALRKH